MKSLRSACIALLTALVAACASAPPPTQQPAAVVITPTLPPLRIGLALGGGAAKGFAHIGVIKILEANGIRPVIVTGTSAGSVVGALYASGMDAYALQERAVALDEAQIRDVSLFSGGLIKGQKLEDYVNAQVGNRTIERLSIPFASVATRLEDGKPVVFQRGNVGQAVRASSAVPGVFEAVTIGRWHYVDGGVVSPVPVDAARALGADFVIAVDIGSKATGASASPYSLLGNINQSIRIMGQRLAAEELKRADVVIRPAVNDIGPADFSQKQRAILDGERALQAALPQIRDRLAAVQAARMEAARTQARSQPATPAPATPSPQPTACVPQRHWLTPWRRDCKDG